MVLWLGFTGNLIAHLAVYSVFSDLSGNNIIINIWTWYTRLTPCQLGSVLITLKLKYEGGWVYS